MNTTPLREGERLDEDGFGIAWALYDPTVSDEFIEDLHGAFYGGPGQPFCRRPHIRRVGKRVLMTQSVGRDI
jgi:hypothetical protein